MLINIHCAMPRLSESFIRHYYPKVEELDDKGEEFLFAQFLDQMEET